MNIFEKMEQVVLCKDASGNFVMFETMAELDAFALKNPRNFPNAADGNPILHVNVGRVEKDENGKWFAAFRKEDGSLNFRMYFDNKPPA